jgi:iron complex outermembrane receptor protein
MTRSCPLFHYMCGLGLLYLSPFANSGELPQVLPSVEVREDKNRIVEREHIRNISGSTSIVFTEDNRDRAVIGLADALEGLPGIYAQRPSGQEAARISIRGSGISSSGIRGVRLLRDGLPLGRLDDRNEAIYADVLVANRIEIYRGASSLQYGAATLGGAINLISPTAYSNPGAEARFEVGSDGLLRSQLKGGKVFNDELDAYASVSHYESTGFRENSAERSSRLYANIGFAFNSTSRGRLHLTEEKYSGGLPGTLTIAQVQNNPGKANPASLAAKAHIQTSPRWHLAYQHDIDLTNGDKLAFGFFHTGTKFDSPTSAVRAFYDAVDYGGALRHVINRNVYGHRNQYVWGVNYGRGSGDNSLIVNPNPLSPLPTSGNVQDRRSNVEIFAENTFHATERLALVAGAQISRASRKIENRTPFFLTEYPNGSASRTYDAFNPKVGAIWDLGRNNAQLYGNLSRSQEAPSSLSFYNKYSLSPPITRTLQAQKATTVEVGTRGGKRELAWDIAVYRSHIDQELLSVANMTSPVLPSVNMNVDTPTYHSGLEFGLTGSKGVPAWSGTVDWNIAYTWNHFRFHNHAKYQNNKLPGIPDHVVQAGLTFRHRNGFYIGPSVSLGSSWYADQANSLKAPGHAVINLNGGYISRKGVRIFMDARNLANKFYASTSDLVVDARVPGTSTAVFRPGQIRAVIVGVEARW